MRDRAERAEEEVVRLQEKLTTEGGMAQVTMELSDKREAEVARLKKEAEVREEEAKEVQAKLSKVSFIVQTSTWMKCSIPNQGTSQKFYQSKKTILIVFFM